MKTPKVAICFYGIPRALDQTAPDILRNLIDPLKAQAEVLCLAHLYNASAVQGETVHPNASALLPLDREEREPPETGLARWPYADIAAFGDYWNNSGVSLRNLILQLHSLSCVTQQALRAGAEQVLFARPDLIYHDSLTPQLDRLLAARDQVFLPDWQHWKGGVNDRMAFCAGQGAIRTYGLRVERMLGFCQQTQSPLQSEQLAAYALWSDALPWSPLHIRATRIRSNGQHVDEDFRPHHLRRLRQRLKLRARWRAKGLRPGQGT